MIGIFIGLLYDIIKKKQVWTILLDPETDRGYVKYKFALWKWYLLASKYNYFCTAKESLKENENLLNRDGERGCFYFFFVELISQLQKAIVPYSCAQGFPPEFVESKFYITFVICCLKVAYSLAGHLNLYVVWFWCP